MPDTTTHTPSRCGGLIALEIPVDRIDPDPDQPRTRFNPADLDRLARSLTTHGQIQPITVRAGRQQDRYVIVTGERRWRAAVAAGLLTVSALVLDSPQSSGGAQPLELQLIENALREGLSPVDQARAFRTLSDRNGWSARQVADVLQIHYSTVTRSLALLSLAGPLLDLVAAGRLSSRTALEVARLDDPDDQLALAARVEAERLTLIETTAIVRSRNAPDPPPTMTPPEAVPGPEAVRVFMTSAGLVTIETLPPHGGFDAVVSAVFEVVHRLRVESVARARESAGCRP